MSKDEERLTRALGVAMKTLGEIQCSCCDSLYMAEDALAEIDKIMNPTKYDEKKEGPDFMGSDC